MKLPRLITRRRVKWAGLVLCVLVLGVYVASAWYAARGWVVNEPKLAVYMGIGRGRLAFAVINSRTSPDRGIPLLSPFRLGPLDRPSIDLWPDFGSRPTVWSYAYVPLWFPLLLIAAPTAWLWHIDRRGKPWQCAKCRYDLRGLDGGVCPECGADRA